MALGLLDTVFPVSTAKTEESLGILTKSLDGHSMT